MSRSEREFEKALKRVVRGENVSAEDLISAWKSLGRGAGRLAVQILNRPDAWKTFARWGLQSAETRRLVEDLSAYPGISGAGLAAIEAAGIDAPASDAPSRRAIGISEAAALEDTGDWARARSIMLADPDVFDGALSLMEAEPLTKAAEFLAGMLGPDLSHEQGQRIRKALYKLRQQGASVQRKQQNVVAEKEWWAFVENRDPHVQFALCFRFHSAFSSTGDLYTLRIWEGKDVLPINQESGLQFSRSRFLEVAGAFARHVSEGIRVELQSQPLSPEHAHFFLRKSISLLPESANTKPLLDFLRFLGAGEGVDPFTGAQPSGDTADASLLQHPYFERWMLDPEDLSGFFEEEKKIEEGPIILVGAPQVEQKREAASAALAGYFEELRRKLWGFLFRKATYFLRKSDPETSASALRIAARFEDLSIPAEQIDAAKILFERSAQIHKQLEEQKRKEASESSLIMTPDQFARSQQRKR